MACCRALCGFSPKLSEQILAKLAEVETVFPHSTLIVVLTPQGELLASRASGNSAFAALPPSEAGQLLAPIASLKKSAVQFGAALNQMECPVIHIRGNHTMFSCYDVDKNLLAFYSSMHSSLLDSFNSTEADNKMSFIIQDLRLLLQNLML